MEEVNNFPSGYGESIALKILKELNPDFYDRLLKGLNEPIISDKDRYIPLTDPKKFD